MADAGRERRKDRMLPYLALVTLALSLAFSLAADAFFSLRNFFNLLDGYAVTGIFAVGLLVVLITGGIDMSFLATASVVQYLTVAICEAGGVEDGLWAGMLIAVGLGAGIGVCIGALIHYLDIVSLIVTISMQSILFGLLMHFSRGRSIYSLPAWMTRYGRTVGLAIGGERYAVGLPPLVMLAMIVLTWFLLKKTTVGRQLYAMGGNAEAARRLGAPLGRLHLFAYGYLGALSAVAGIAQVFRMGEVVPGALVGRELDILAAVVLGGASLAGGRGEVLGTLLGVTLIGVLKNGLILVGVSSYFLDVAVGTVIIVAVIATHHGRRSETEVGFA